MAAMEKRTSRLFRRFQKQAETYLEDSSQLPGLLEKAGEKAEQNVSLLREGWEDLQLLLRLMTAFARRRYTDISLGSVLSIIGALLYFVVPTDAIPDFLTGFGYIDDLSVIAFVISRIRGEVSAFRQWEANQQDPGSETNEESASS